MPDLCRICTTNKLAATELSTQICSECRTNLGVVEMPPPRRPRLPCTRCQTTRFIRVLLREHIVLDSVFSLIGTQSNAVRSTYVPMAATHEPRVVKRPPLGMTPQGSITNGPDLRQPRGLLARYICCGCGLVEVFCEDPESIPIGPEYMSDVVDFGPTSAYR